jgi:sulfatase maturation enzyme AslB (radical SAM superfamily)
MSHESLAIIIDKLLDHMECKAISKMTIYWQGGEIMILPPAWFYRAQEMIQKAANARGKQIEHSLQSNMIGYSRHWNQIILEMFGNNVGTSMDFPNLNRKAKNHPPEHYTDIWTRNVLQAREAGIQVGVISIPNKETVRLVPNASFYFVDELDINWIFKSTHPSRRRDQ